MEVGRTRGESAAILAASLYCPPWKSCWYRLTYEPSAPRRFARLSILNASSVLLRTVRDDYLFVSGDAENVALLVHTIDGTSRFLRGGDEDSLSSYAVDVDARAGLTVVKVDKTILRRDRQRCAS